MLKSTLLTLILIFAFTKITKSNLMIFQKPLDGEPMFPAAGDISGWFSRSLKLALVASSTYGLKKKKFLLDRESK